MRLLLIHADHIGYEVKSKTKFAEEIPEGLKAQEAEEALVVFVAVEKNDGSEPSRSVDEAVAEIEKVYGDVKAKNIFLYPYAHLSPSLAGPQVALKVLKELEKKLGSKYTVKRAPFGYYKAFDLKCKGHPLSELSKQIEVGKARERVSEALKSEKKLKSEWFILHGGELVPAEKFDFSGHPSLKTFYDYETKGTRAVDREPPHLMLMKEHELVDHEPGSDQGNLRWYPKGELIKKLMEEHVTNILLECGAMEVETPIMYDFQHPQLQEYINRFPARQYVVKSDDKEFFLRFAACFGQYLIKQGMGISYKHLPLRLYELTHYAFRREQSGELSGLKRLRSFTMPDMHTLCKNMEEAKGEFVEQFKLSMRWMADMEFEYDVAMRLLKDFYHENEDFIKGLAELSGKPILVELWDQRFFYFVMKFEFSINDALKKAATLSTVQIDVENTERFGITYTDEDGSKKHPLMLHASISGGLDRNLYAVLEKEWMRSQRGEKPSFPLWLAPTQVRVIPVSEEYLPISEKLLTDFQNAEIRADLDDESLTLEKKIRNAEKEWVPYIVVVGKREAESGKLAVRVREEGGKVGGMTQGGLIDRIKGITSGKPFRRLPLPDRLSKRPRFR
ncbi:MAG: threonine--tRNA ligase [Candidatus Hydrothermarchaeaceae archaeon]